MYLIGLTFIIDFTFYMDVIDMYIYILGLDFDILFFTFLLLIVLFLNLIMVSSIYEIVGFRVGVRGQEDVLVKNEVWVLDPR